MPLPTHLRRAILVAAAVLAQEPVAGQAQWLTVTNEDGRFSVSVPGPLSMNGPTTNAQGIVTTTFAGRYDGKAYVVVYSDGPIHDWRVEMDAARDALLNGLPATLVSQHHFKSAQPVGDIEAMEFTARNESAGTECKARVFWHKSRMYMLGTFNRSGTGSALDTDRFLDSFRITS